jgi:transcriptional regulator with XRE-family HTH domain
MTTTSTSTAVAIVQPAFTARAGMSEGGIECIEEGGTEPTVPLLRRLAEALNADVRLTAGHDLGSLWFETHAARPSSGTGTVSFCPASIVVDVPRSLSSWRTAEVRRQGVCRDRQDRGEEYRIGTGGWAVFRHDRFVGRLHDHGAYLRLLASADAPAMIICS